MHSEIILTDDGSATLFVPELKEQYHSRNGAVQESEHVFIQTGLAALDKIKLSIFEMGFGTGLNAILTYLWAKKSGCSINYHCIEKYPLEPEKVNLLAYPKYLQLNAEEKEIFERMHNCEWGIEMQLSAGFSFTKEKTDLETFESSLLFDLVYFDAFAPEIQPALWTEKVFEKMFQLMNPDSFLVTYCAKGEVRRRLQRSGFSVERLPGPPGKREMLRAHKCH